MKTWQFILVVDLKSIVSDPQYALYPTPGMVFVVQSDLTRLACDVHMIPSKWISTEDADAFSPVEITSLQREFAMLRTTKVDLRAHKVLSWPSERAKISQAWLVDVVLQAGRIDRVARDFLDLVARDLHQASVIEKRLQPLNRRSRFLVAMPVLGSSAVSRSGHILDVLLPELFRATMLYGYDVILVCASVEMFTAALSVRAQCQAKLTHSYAELDLNQKTHANELGKLVRANQVTFFMGAGCSMGAGAPSWVSLIDSIGAEVGFETDAQKNELKKLSITNQAMILDGRLSVLEKAKRVSASSSTSLQRTSSVADRLALPPSPPHSPHMSTCATSQLLNNGISSNLIGSATLASASFDLGSKTANDSKSKILCRYDRGCTRADCWYMHSRPAVDYSTGVDMANLGLNTDSNAGSCNKPRLSLTNPIANKSHTRMLHTVDEPLTVIHVVGDVPSSTNVAYGPNCLDEKQKTAVCDLTANTAKSFCSSSSSSTAGISLGYWGADTYTHHTNSAVSTTAESIVALGSRDLSPLLGQMRQRLIVFQSQPEAVVDSITTADTSAAVSRDVWAQRRLRDLNLVSDCDVVSLKRNRSVDTMRHFIQPSTRASSLQNRISQKVDMTKFSLVHSLLACMPSKEFITTNYDLCFEMASRAAETACLILPYDPIVANERWCLKLHGCVSVPEDIVITREDYIHFEETRKALAGIVSTSVIVKRVVFVGFGLVDDNFFQIFSSVRNSMAQRRRVSGEQQRFGTALTVSASPLVREMWGEELDIVEMGSSEHDSVGDSARKLEIFLDLMVSVAVTNTPFLMNPNFAFILSPTELRFADAVRQFVSTLDPQLRSCSAFGLVEDLVTNIGGSAKKIGPRASSLYSASSRPPIKNG